MPGIALELVILVVVVTSVWVLFDARSAGMRKGQATGVADMGPVGWFLACLLLWLVAFPLYLAKRAALATPAFPVGAGRFCTGCGQGIRGDARYCPGCGETPSKDWVLTPCPICCAELPALSAFCTACGAPGPAATAEQRAAWRERRTATRPAASARKPIGIGLVVVALLGGIGALVAVPRLAAAGQLDVVQVEQEIATQLQAITAETTAVECPPEVPMRKGKIFDCAARDVTGEVQIRVTLDDDEGHFSFEPFGTVRPIAAVPSLTATPATTAISGASTTVATARSSSPASALKITSASRPPATTPPTTAEPVVPCPTGGLIAEVTAVRETFYSENNDSYVLSVEGTLSNRSDAAAYPKGGEITVFYGDGSAIGGHQRIGNYSSQVLAPGESTPWRTQVTTAGAPAASARVDKVWWQWRDFNELDDGCATG